MKTLHILLLLPSVLLLTTSSAVARPTSPVRVPLTICLTNEAGVSPKQLTEVEGRITDIFKESAIKVRWLNSGSGPDITLTPTSCGSLSYPDQLMIHWIPKGRTVPPYVLGEAFLDEQETGVIADLFLDHVRSVESETKVGFVNLLAFATAHEIGHLLLGANSHSTRGIMQGHFYGQELAAIRHGGLTFERSEEERMHSRLLAEPCPRGLASAK